MSGQQRPLCILPLNVEGEGISHPVIGGVIQSPEDFERVDTFPEEPGSDVTHLKARIKIPSRSSSSSSSSLFPDPVRVEFANTDGAYLKRFLEDKARKCSVVVPRELLAADALTLYDVRIEQNAPNSNICHILKVLELLFYLLGDGIDLSYRGKIASDLTSAAEKEAEKAKKVHDAIVKKNIAIQAKNLKAIASYNKKLEKWMASMRKKAKRRKISDDDDDDEESKKESDDDESGESDKENEDDDDNVMEEKAFEVSDFFEEEPSSRKRSNKPEMPEMLPLLEVPELPRQLYPTEKQLGEMLEGVKLEGGPRDKTFSVRMRTDGPVLFERVKLDIEHVYDQNLHQSDEESLLSSAEPSAYIYTFYVYDPRISLMQGLRRLHARNQDTREARLNKKKLNSDNLRQSTHEKELQEHMFVYSRRENSFMDSFDDWEEWAAAMKVACGNPAAFDRYADTTTLDSAIKNDGEYLDPFFLLDPAKQLLPCGPSEYDFNLLVPKSGGTTLQRAAKRAVSTQPLDFMNSYTMNGSWVPDHGFYLDAPPLEDLRWPRIENDKISVRVYRCPHNVVRVSGKDIDHVILMASILPNYMIKAARTGYYDKGTPMEPFPTLPANAAAKMRQHNRDIKAKLMKGSANPLENPTHTICETISDRYFMKNGTLRPAYQAMPPDDFFDEVFRMSISALATHSPYLPRGMQTIVRFHDSIESSAISAESGSIYPDLKMVKDSALNLANASDYFYEGFSRKMLCGPMMNISQMHSLGLFAISTLPLQYQREVTQSLIFVMGPKSGGKSKLFEMIHKNLIETTITSLDSMSAQAMNSGENCDGICFFTDDTGDNDAFFKSEQKGAPNNVSQMKTLLSTGRLVRQILDVKPRGRAEIITSMKGMFIKLTNLVINERRVDSAILDRSFTFFVPQCVRPGGASSQLYANSHWSEAYRSENELQLVTLLTRFQIFGAYMGFFRSTGVLKWKASIHRWPQTIYFNRFKKVYARIHGHSLADLSSRFSDDRLAAVLYGCVCLRLWAEKCEKDPTLNKDHSLDQGFDFEYFKEIAKGNKAIVTQGDFIHAISLLGEMITHRCEMYFILWLKKRLAELNYDPVRSCEEGLAYWRTIPTAFKRDNVDPKFVPADATLESMGTDVNLLDLKIEDVSRDKVLKTLVMLVTAEYQRFIHRHDKEEELEPFLETAYLKNSSGDTIKPWSILQGSLTQLDTPVARPILTIETKGDKVRIFLLRSWMDEWFRHEDSFYRNPMYKNTGFLTNPTYATTQAMFKYNGSTPGEYIFPGLGLSNTDVVKKEYEDLEPGILMRITVTPGTDEDLIIGEIDGFEENCLKTVTDAGAKVVYFKPSANIDTFDKLAMARAQTFTAADT